MDVLAYLKPENGPVGKVLGAWLDHEPSGRTTRLLIFVFVAALPRLPLISNAPLGPPPELLDTYAKTLHPAPAITEQRRWRHSSRRPGSRWRADRFLGDLPAGGGQCGFRPVRRRSRGAPRSPATSGSLACCFCC
jgi:hypothetical protein